LRAPGLKIIQPTETRRLRGALRPGPSLTRFNWRNVPALPSIASAIEAAHSPETFMTRASWRIWPHLRGGGERKQLGALAVAACLALLPVGATHPLAQEAPRA
jgi:hypothetical protein